MDHDLIVIGGGAAGLAAVRTGLWAGADMALVTDGPIGGDCTFTGCVPSKTLIAAASAGLGFGEAMDRVRTVVEHIAATESAEVWRRRGVTVLEGRARLMTHDTVAVDGKRVTAPRIVIATGSRPAIPPIEGLADLGGSAGGAVLTTDTLFELESRPDSLGIVGGGPTGCELAQALARLGVEVCLFEAADRVLPTEEPEASSIVAAALAADGVKVQTSAPVTGVEVGGSASATAEGVEVSVSRLATAVAEEPGASDLVTGAGTEVSASGPITGAAQDGNGVTVRAGSQSVAVERLLLAAGRAPAADGLGLAELKVKLDRRGWVVTDARLATSIKGVYAAGDVTGRTALTHAADEMGRLAAANALGRGPRGRFREEWVPQVIFTDPEVARVGAVEAEAPPRSRVAYLPLVEVDRAIIAGRADGFVKIIAGPRPVVRRLGGGRVIGAAVVAPRAGEMIAEVALAMRTRAFTGRLAQTAHAYPTWSHGIQKAAAQFFGEIEGRRARPPRRA